jgi:ketopantoate reductase
MARPTYVLDLEELLGCRVERGRRLEIEEILGYVVRKGAEFGLPLPTVTTCYRLLAGIDRSLR